MNKESFKVVKTIIWDKERNALSSPYYRPIYNDYVIKNQTSSSYTWSNKALELIKRYDKFNSLISKFNTIKGTTNSNKEFSLDIITKSKNITLKIYSNKNEYFTSTLEKTHLFHYGIIQYVNRVDNSIKKLSLIKKNEQKVVIKGKVGNLNYKFNLKVYSSDSSYRRLGIQTELDFENTQETRNKISVKMPDHIPKEQYFKYLFTSVTNYDVVLELIEKYFKQYRSYCCGNQLSNNYNFCPKCGGKYVLPEIVVDDISYGEKFTVLTK